MLDWTVKRLELELEVHPEEALKGLFLCISQLRRKLKLYEEVIPLPGQLLPPATGQAMDTRLILLKEYIGLQNVVKSALGEYVMYPVKDPPQTFIQGLNSYLDQRFHNHTRQQLSPVIPPPIVRALPAPTPAPVVVKVPEVVKPPEPAIQMPTKPPVTIPETPKKPVARRSLVPAHKARKVEYQSDGSVQESSEDEEEELPEDEPEDVELSDDGQEEGEVEHDERQAEEDEDTYRKRVLQERTAEDATLQEINRLKRKRIDPLDERMNAIMVRFDDGGAVLQVQELRNKRSALQRHIHRDFRKPPEFGDRSYGRYTSMLNKLAGYDYRIGMLLGTAQYPTAAMCEPEAFHSFLDQVEASCDPVQHTVRRRSAVRAENRLKMMSNDLM